LPETPAESLEKSTNKPTNADVAPELMEEKVTTMTVNQLKEELAKMKLSKNGVKGILQQHLLANLNVPVSFQGEAAQVLPQTNKVEGLQSDTKWRELVHNPNQVEEPSRPNHLQGFTLSENEKEFEKLNFDGTLEHPPFIAMSPVIKLGTINQPLKDRKGQPVFKNEIRKRGGRM
jgi:hypothetical protein